MGKIKAFGRLAGNYQGAVWRGMRQIIVYKGLIGKFSHNEDLKKRSLATGQDILAECAVQDKMWGSGLIYSCPLPNTDKPHKMDIL